MVPFHEDVPDKSVPTCSSGGEVEDHLHPVTPTPSEAVPEIFKIPPLMVIGFEVVMETKGGVVSDDPAPVV